MANNTFQGRMIQKHDTKANWDKATNFVPLKGEIIIYDDLKKIKIGDGATKVGNLVFINDLDTINGKYLSLAGGTMTGNININNKTITNLKTPTADTEAANKKYVDDQIAATFTASKAGTVPASGGGTTKYLRADGTWTTIDKTPVIGTNTNYAIYIGTTAPASGTTPLLWIDTTSSTGFLKYRSSNTSAWTAVPVAWTE